MKKRTLFVLISISFLLLSAQNVMAQRIGLKAFHKDTEEFGFARDYIESLHYLKVASELMQRADPKNVNYDNEVDMITTFMKNLRLANRDLRMSKGILNKYKNSNNELMKMTADLVSLSYDKQIKINNEGLKLYEGLFNSRSGDSDEEFDHGSFLREISKLAADKEVVLQSLLKCSMMLTHILVSKVPDKEGNINFLTVSSEEREKLIRIIDKIFGDSVKGGMRPGQNYLDACAAVVRQVLADPGWKTSDDR